MASRSRWIAKASARTKAGSRLRRPRGARELDLLHDGSQPLEHLGGGPIRRQVLLVDVLGVEAAGQAEAHAFEVDARGRRGSCRGRAVPSWSPRDRTRRGRRAEARDRPRRGAIGPTVSKLHVIGKTPRLLTRPERRPEPADAVQRRRDSHRAPCVGSEGDPRTSPRRAPRPSRRSSRQECACDPRDFGMHRGEGSAGRPVRKLVQRRLPEENGTGLAQAARDLGIPRGHTVGEESRSGRRAHSSGVDVVLERYGNAVERSEPLPPTRGLVGGRSLRASDLARDGDEGVQLLVVPLDAPQVALGQGKRSASTISSPPPPLARGRPRRPAPARAGRAASAGCSGCAHATAPRRGLRRPRRSPA